jgi:hypothetical protein
MVVAGGGGGGTNKGGGGGAGGFRESSGTASGCYTASPLGACVLLYQLQLQQVFQLQLVAVVLVFLPNL